mgnify:CR=1 FL=1
MSANATPTPADAGWKLIFSAGPISGAAVKLLPITDLPFEVVETLIFEGLLLMQSRRLAL